FEAFKDIYRSAYAEASKGCTTYRPNDVTGAVLETSDAADKVPAPISKSPLIAAPAFVPSASIGNLPSPAMPAAATAHAHAEIAPLPKEMSAPGGVVYMTKPLDRPGVLIGETYKVRWPDLDHAFYITINDLKQDGRRRPFEIFINSKNMEHYA
ncbi:MAG: hypothetical protein ACKVG0_13405, partial [Alphaproteobacteria bacterium]